MEPKDSIIRMLQALEIHNIYASKQYYKELCNLVKTDIKKFITDFTRDFIRKNLKEYKRYERLHTNANQNKRLDGNALFRYEYRNSSNLRCIYIIVDVNNTNATILLTAFNEDKNKRIGKNAYDFNIEKAIKIYEDIKTRRKRN